MNNNKIVISCEQCHRSIKVPTNRGSIKVQCPHCEAIFILTPDLMITKKKCLKCGHEHQEKYDKYEIPSTECPKCHAIYEIVEKQLKEKDRKEQEKRDLADQRERYRKNLEERNHQSPIKSWHTTAEVKGTKLSVWLDKYFLYIWMWVFIVGLIILGFWSDISFTKGWDRVLSRKGILGW